MHARLLAHSVLARSIGRLEPEMFLKFQVVLSLVRLSPGRSKTGTCERGVTHFVLRLEMSVGAPFELRVVVTPFTPLHRYCGLLW